MRKFVKLMMLFLLFAGLTNLASAQVTTSSLGGIVKAADGETLEGATVKATHLPSGSVYYNYVKKGGSFSIPSMRAGGPYTIEASFIGYRTKTLTDVQLMLGEEYVLDLTLENEATQLEGALVTAQTKENVKQSGMSKSFSVREINAVPTISRSLNDIITLTSQAHVTEYGANIGGGNNRQSFVTVDGAAFNNAFGIGQNLPGSGSPISIDALDQISVNISPFDVRQSGFTGASINAVTRSGDNETRASAYYYFNNESMRGNKVGDYTFDKSKSKYQLFGARVGGAIVKNKLFYFLSYEQENSIEPGPASVAATPEKPYTTGNDGIARPTEAQMNDIKDYLVNTYGYNPGVYQGYSSESPGHKVLARIDWNISKNHKFNIRFSDTKSKYPAPPSTSTSGLADRNFSSNSRQAITAIYFENARYFQELNFRSYAGELTSRLFDGKVNNLLRVSHSHQFEPRSTEGGEFPFVDILEGEDILTSFGSELFSYGNLRDVKTMNFTDEVSFQLGSHRLSAGVQYETNTTKNGFQRFGSGYYQFNSIADFKAGNVNQFAITHSFNKDYSQAFPTFKYNQWSFYLQDEFVIDELLKVTMGLRAELPSYPVLNTYNKQVAETDLGTPDVNVDKTTRYTTDRLPENRIMWSPRLGFSLDLLGNKSLIFRGGTGVFTGRIPFVWIVAQAGDAGVLQNTYTAKAGGTDVVPTFTKDRIDMLNQIYPSGATQGEVNVNRVTLIDPNLKMPQTWKTFLALDAHLPNRLNLSVEGIYSKDINPAVVLNVGLKPAVSTAIPGYADNRLVYGPRYDSKLKDAYLLTNAQNAGHYYSLTFKADKRFDFGLNASLSYSYSGAKNVTDGVGSQVASAYYNPSTVNGINQQDISYAGYVMPHRIVGTLSYRKEYLKHFATTISLVYEGGPQGRASYVFAKSVIGDGGANNLIYVPKTKDELTFVDYTPTYKDAVLYTAAEQREDFWNFVNSNEYLKSRKGKYAERNGAIYPWVNGFGLKISQDIFVNVGNKRNTIQIGLDILNIGNLLNKNWGTQWYITRANILEQANKLTQNGTEKPKYKFMKDGTQTLTKDYVKALDLASTYSMQLSLRYIFN